MVSQSEEAKAALREATRLGLQLVRSSRSNTGFKCVANIPEPTLPYPTVPEPTLPYPTVPEPRCVAYNACYAKRPFKVQVTEGGRQLRLGDFPTAEEAALCYAKQLHDNGVLYTAAEGRGQERDGIAEYGCNRPIASGRVVLFADGHTQPANTTPFRISRVVLRAVTLRGEGTERHPPNRRVVRRANAPARAVVCGEQGERDRICVQGQRK